MPPTKSLIDNVLYILHFPSSNPLSSNYSCRPFDRHTSLRTPVPDGFRRRARRVNG